MSFSAFRRAASAAAPLAARALCRSHHSVPLLRPLTLRASSLTEPAATAAPYTLPTTARFSSKAAVASGDDLLRVVDDEIKCAVERNDRDRRSRNSVTRAKSVDPKTRKELAGLRRINLEGLRWRVFDAKGQILGRLASQLSTVVQGKDKPTYAPNRDDGDICIVLNAKEICVTGRKLTNKFYRWHTGYVGHLKERSLKDQLVKDPTEVIRKAVLRMLPRNKLRDDRARKLRIFTGGEHPFGDRPLETYVMPPRKVREMRPRARRALIRSQKKAEGGSNKPTKKNEDKAQLPA